MDNRMRTNYPYKLNKGIGLKSCEGYSDQQTPEEGQSAQWSKCCDNKTEQR